MEKDILLIGTKNFSLYKDACQEIEIHWRTADDFSSCKEAFEQKKPALFIVDSESLGEKSIEISQTLKKYPGTQYISLLFLSDKEKTSELMEAMFIPVNDYMLLPLNMEEFKMRVKSQLLLEEFKEKKRLISVDEKIKELQSLVKDFPSYNAAWQELAEIYEKTNAIKEAIQTLFELTKNYYQQKNFGLARDTITQIKKILSNQTLSAEKFSQFTESLERCLQLLK
jgi:response regulator RpfG family c-di-GMP phosphodiesterase